MRKPEKLEYFQPPRRFPLRRRSDTRSPGSRGKRTELVAASRVTSGSLAKAEMTGQVFNIRLTCEGKPNLYLLGHSSASGTHFPQGFLFLSVHDGLSGMWGCEGARESVLSWDKEGWRPSVCVCGGGRHQAVGLRGNWLHGESH